MAVPPQIIDTSTPPAPTQSRLPLSSHRLPTISASQALQDLRSNGLASVPSGIRSLDVLLAGSSASGYGGFQRGKTTEIWGPSGTGKTGLMLQTAVQALQRGEHVVWIDAATPMSGPRLRSVWKHDAQLSDGNAQSTDSREDCLKCFHYYALPTLSHLLALVLHKPSDFPPDGTSLLIIDGLNTIIDIDYPRTLAYSTSGRTEQQKWQAGRRYAVLGSLITGLNKLAVLHNLATIVSTGCASRMRGDSGLGSALVPGLGGGEWDGGIWSRMVIFRDFSGRFVGVQKCQGRSLIGREEIGETGRLVAFEMTGCGGVRDRSQGRSAFGGVAQPKKVRSPVKPRKRTFDEVADSEGEDVDEYGWVEEDNDVLADETAVNEQPGVTEAGAGDR